MARKRTPQQLERECDATREQYLRASLRRMRERAEAACEDRSWVAYTQLERECRAVHLELAALRTQASAESTRPKSPQQVLRALAAEVREWPDALRAQLLAQIQTH
jgi:hypothetical protein